MAERQAKKGDKVKVVTANGQHVDAKVTEVNGRLVDVTFEHPKGSGNEVVITSSPNDPTGKKPDCWFFPAEQEEAKAPAK